MTKASNKWGTPTLVVELTVRHDVVSMTHQVKKAGEEWWRADGIVKRKRMTEDVGEVQSRWGYEREEDGRRSERGASRQHNLSSQQMSWSERKRTVQKHSPKSREHPDRKGNEGCLPLGTDDNMRKMLRFSLEYIFLVKSVFAPRAVGVVRLAAPLLLCAAHFS